MAVPKSRPAGRRRSSQEAAAADFREAAAADFREADQAVADQAVEAVQAACPAGRRRSSREAAAADMEVVVTNLRPSASSGNATQEYIRAGQH